ncbi:SusC/RagA family TonB-linked outer membrane protein [Pedobacter cryoconitis]|uniref:TonB-linked SusC/RagA family outer membrane protein n=1 Tax=Pedobacter cryoconitis TaxID=188932 RepID=A0A7X0J4V6_9SPHI|nr:SusC/RagA family TonB-linked outer membrane protein [Pedobacter cryoconitis]MBB6500910.1 TonB-linked SusC/RagA family outer membrane protein [Pedobacter cryoconitis]
MEKTLPNFLRMLLTLVFVCLINIHLFAQNVQLKGTVTDETKAPLPGASIKIKGTTTGTISSSNGTYSLSVPKGKTIVISSIGYLTQEVVTSGEPVLNFELKNDSKLLTEVVVTALGIKKDVRKIGYATQEIKGSELVKAREPNAINSLTGKIAGLTVGGNAELLGRPQLVLRGSTDLLFVVDGVPVNSDTWNISADDIETYTVLKGPNAAALYGFRGQNGAILVTTKKGTKDGRGFTVELNSSTMFEKGYTAVPKAQTQYGYGNDYKYAYGNDLYDLDGSYRRTNIWGPKFDGQGVAQYDSPVDPVTGVRTKTPWLAKGVNNFENFMEMGLLSTNNVSVSASGDKYDMRTSVSHTYQKGMAPNTKLNIDNMNIYGGYNFSPKWRMDANLNFNSQYTPNIPDVSYGPNSYVYQFKVYGSASWDLNDVKDYYGGPRGRQGLVQNFVEYGRHNNPYFTANEWLHSHKKTDINGYAKLSYKVNDNLNFSLRSQVTTWNQLRTEKVPPSTNLNQYVNDYYFNKTNGVYNIWYGDYREDQRNLIEHNHDFLANYNKKFSEDFNLSGSAGANLRTFEYNSTWATTYALTLPGVYTLANSQGPVKSYNFGSKMQVSSGYYTFDFGIKNWLNINTTGRVDKLSTLPAGHDVFFYPSVSLSSVVSDYVKLPEFISFLKLRGSFADVRGALTSPTIGTAYNALTGNTVGTLLGGGTYGGYGTELYSSYDGPTYDNQNTYNVNTYYNNTPSVDYSKNIANNNIKPFDVKSYEAGTEIRFLKNRLGVDFTYFTSINGPLVFQLPVAPSTGYSTESVNAITSKKKGWELSVTGTPVKTQSGFSWDVMANLSTYKETLSKIYNGVDGWAINNHNYKVGERLDGIYGRAYVRAPDGQIIHDASGLPLAQQAGVNNNQLLGYANPDFVFGFNNKFSYKNFSFSFQFDGRIGGKIFDYVYAQMLNAGTAADLVQGQYGDARLKEWQSTNGGTVNATGAMVGNGVVITSGTPHYTNGKIDNYDQLTFAQNGKAVTLRNYIQNGVYGLFDEPFMVSRSYVKLREVVIGYNLPKKFLAKSFIRSASISLIGRNLLYFAKRKDIDLDQYASGFNLSSKSLGGKQSDLQSSTARRFGVNLSIGF